MFVCTGNICRSPTAERLTSWYATQAGLVGLEVHSAGTGAMIGHPIHPYAVRTLEQLGADPKNFAGRQLNASIASDADLVITMTKAQRNDVVELAPQQLHKTYMLSEIAQIASRYSPRDLNDLAVLRLQLPADDKFDVADPIGRSQEFFDSVGAQIAELVDPLVRLCGNHSA